MTSCTDFTGVEFDANQNLIVVDPRPPAEEEVYAPPYSGAPTFRIVNNAYDPFPFGVAINKANTRLYVANEGTSSIDVYKLTEERP